MKINNLSRKKQVRRDFMLLTGSEQMIIGSCRREYETEQATIKLLHLN